MTWNSGLLEDLVFFQRGFDITKDQQADGDVPVVSSSGINSYHSEAMVTGPGVVIGRKGSLGTAHFIDVDYWPHDTTLWSKDFKGNDPKFVYYFVQTLGLQRYDVGNSNPTLNRNHIHKLEICYPDRRTQEGIARFLEKYDDLIANNKRRIELLEQSARLLFKEWFVHLRYPGHEHDKIVNGVPNGWGRMRLREVCTLRAGEVFKPHLQGESSGDFPFIKVGDFSTPGNSTCVVTANNWVSESVVEVSRFKVFPAKTSVFAKIGEALRQNRVRYFTRETIADNNLMGAIPNESVVDGPFLFFLLKTIDLATHASGAAVPFLSAGVLNDIEVLIPARPRIEEFSEQATKLLEQIALLERQSLAASKARDLLLPRLMDGRISV